ncbi:transposase [candidate division KSB1 bacterium]|nr:transposase [candidate division KSB1 bacterium]
MSAIGLFLEMGGCVTNFESAKNISSFWGLHPKIDMSGDGGTVYRMSKEGRSMPRAILFMAVLNGIKTKSFIFDLYQKELKNGKCKLSAIGVCMHKLARIVFGVLKNNTPFDLNIDKQNKTRSISKKKKTSNNSENRWYQKEDQDAPISKRQHKKRKEREQSQGKNIAVYEIKIPGPSKALSS